jgi:hypothetical protein
MNKSTANKIALKTCSGMWGGLVEGSMSKPTMEQLKKGIKD